MAHSSLAIANEFIRRAEGRPLTHMQVQKLVYLAHGWSLGALGQPLIDDDVEAWAFGPVVRKLYDALRDYGRGPITRPIRWGDDTPFLSDDGEEAVEPLSDDEQTVIDVIWEKYGHFPAFKLSAMTHEPDTPWFNAYEPGRNGAISDEAIREYFHERFAQA
jgi:uncharacterized phage-associated protein